MPNIKSAEKRVLVTAKKNAENKQAKSALKTALKKYSATLAENPENGAAALKETTKQVDRAVAKGLMHKNTAARRKSAMARALNEAK